MAFTEPPPLSIAQAFSVTGKVAVVTGAAGLIGSGIVEAFAVNGAKVVASDKPGSALAQRCASFASRGLQVAPHAADLCEVPALQELVAATLRLHGCVDVLVNCGAIPGSERLGREGPEDFDRLFHTNVRSLWLLTQYAAEAMGNAGGGSVVNIASVNGHRPTSPFALYAGTKAAVINMTRDLAVELAPRNVRVNSISPGLIQSGADLLQGVTQALKPPYKNDFEARFAPLAREARVQNQPLAAVGAPADIAMACIYLASAAARFVTGADLLVDGGWIHMFHARLGGSRTAWRAMVRFLRRLPPDAWLVGRPAWLNA